MSTTITGVHRYVEGPRALNHHKKQMRHLPAGEVITVSAGNMVGVKSTADGVRDEPIQVKDGRHYVKYGPLVVEAVSKIKITGPAFVSSPAPSRLDEISTFERSWVNRFLIKVGVQITLLCIMLLVAAEMFTPGMAPRHYFMIAVAFVLPVLVVGRAIQKRGHGQIKTAEITVFPKHEEPPQSSS